MPRSIRQYPLTNGSKTAHSRSPHHRLRHAVGDYDKAFLSVRLPNLCYYDCTWWLRRVSWRRLLTLGAAKTGAYSVAVAAQLLDYPLSFRGRSRHFMPEQVAQYLSYRRRAICILALQVYGSDSPHRGVPGAQPILKGRGTHLPEQVAQDPYRAVLAQRSFQLPHLGDWTHAGQPFLHGQRARTPRVSRAASSNVS